MVRDSAGNAPLSEVAADYERAGYMHRQYAASSRDEQWAVHFGEVFFGPSARDFVEFAEMAPARAVCCALVAGTLCDSDSCRFVESYLARVRFVMRQIFPDLLANLRQCVREGVQHDHYHAASGLLVALSKPGQLDHCPGLAELDLSPLGCLSSEVMNIVSSLYDLKSLKATGTVGWNCGSNLKRLVNLERIDLANTDADNTTVRSLPNSLVEIDLSGSVITDLGLVHLESMPRLRKVNFSGTLVTRRGIARFRSQHPNGHNVDLVL